MVENKIGRIINLASTSALGNSGHASYGAAKVGIQDFTKTLAIELGKFRVTSNAIVRAFIETDMSRTTAERMDIPFATYAQELSQQISVRRAGKPKDFANVASFFADEASFFVNGQVIYVSGGPKV